MMQQYNQFDFKFFIFHIANERKSSAPSKIIEPKIKHYFKCQDSLDRYKKVMHFYDMLHNKQLNFMGMAAGMPDYCILTEQGKVAFLEYKINDNELTQAQKAFKDQCEQFNIPYGLAYNVDMGISFIKSLPFVFK